MLTAEQHINNYANSMFRFERLNDAWIDSCAAYLQYVFGDRLLGKTVVDYAFGRGNWSLAFLKAGASKVIAIDAATDNVARFSRYCRQNGIADIEVIEGNVLSAPINADADIVWLYGILHHVEPAALFLKHITALAPRDDALFYVYAYNRDSLREFVVNACRRVCQYDNEQDFRTDAPYLTRAARLRGRDDLTAPHIDWYRSSDLAELLASNGLYATVRHDGFEKFNNSFCCDEFQPHQWLCQRGEAGKISVLDAKRRYEDDVNVLKSMWQSIVTAGIAEPDLQKIGLGLFNAHFAALENTATSEGAVIEDFQFLLYVLISHDVELDNQSPASRYTTLALASLNGNPTDQIAAASDDTLVAHHLRTNRIRL